MSWFLRLVFTAFLAISVSEAALRCGDLFTKEKAVQEYRANYARIKKSMEELDMRDLGPVGKGSFGARWVEFSDGTRGIWKPDDPKFDSANHEAAVARIDHHLDLNKVPITVLRSLNGTRGSVQLVILSLKSKQMPFTPDELGFLDYQIANTDRSGQNLLQMEDGTLIAIDHGITFGKDGNWRFDNGFNRFNKNVILLNALIRERKNAEARLQSASPSQKAAIQKEMTESKLEEAKLHSAIKMFMPEESVVTRLSNTSKADWKKILEDTITESELDAMMERQARLLHAIQEAEAKLGKEILYADGAYSPLIGTKSAPPPTNNQNLNNFKNRRNFEY